ncbi:hypothetical protein FACS189487_00790 [Campylobacterota bacterium]|nr:hypothetical protein FACS189487_00790 [Campylobacterota bacterium]
MYRFILLFFVAVLSAYAAPNISIIPPINVDNYIGIALAIIAGLCVIWAIRRAVALLEDHMGVSASAKEHASEISHLSELETVQQESYDQGYLEGYEQCLETNKYDSGN